MTGIGWTFPPDLWIKGNIDGSVQQGNSTTTCGGALKGAHVNVSSTELLGIYTSLDIACQTTLRRYGLRVTLRSLLVSCKMVVLTPNVMLLLSKLLRIFKIVPVMFALCMF